MRTYSVALALAIVRWLRDFEAALLRGAEAHGELCGPVLLAQAPYLRALDAVEHARQEFSPPFRPGLAPPWSSTGAEPRRAA